MPTNEPRLWEELYRRAVLEIDPARIQERIALARDALEERRNTLRQIPRAQDVDVDGDGVGDGERERTEDAMRTLELIRSTELRTRIGSNAPV